jgi:hypothetical protein
MFGKGVYFADMVSKSANYCYTSKMNPVGLLLLCEVALGQMYVASHPSLGGRWKFYFVFLVDSGMNCLELNT